MLDIGNMVLDSDILKNGMMVFIDEENKRGKLYIRDLNSPIRQKKHLDITKKVNDGTLECPEQMDTLTHSIMILTISFIYNWEDIQINGEEFPFTEENLYRVFYDESFYSVANLFCNPIVRAINKMKEYYAEKEEEKKK